MYTFLPQGYSFPSFAFDFFVAEHSYNYHGTFGYKQNSLINSKYFQLPLFVVIDSMSNKENYLRELLQDLWLNFVLWEICLGEFGSSFFKKVLSFVALRNIEITHLVSLLNMSSHSFIGQWNYWDYIIHQPQRLVIKGDYMYYINTLSFSFQGCVAFFHFF